METITDQRNFTPDSRFLKVVLLGEDVVPVGELRRRLPALLADGHFPPCRAFLHRRNWHERARLGWVAADHPTECEERGHDVRRCKFRHHASEAILVTSNEPREVWQPKFWERFASGCRDDEVAVVVDYHI